jgi:hypothetical protein
MDSWSTNFPVVESVLLFGTINADVTLAFEQAECHQQGSACIDMIRLAMLNG